MGRDWNTIQLDLQSSISVARKAFKKKCFLHAEPQTKPSFVRVSGTWSHHPSLGSVEETLSLLHVDSCIMPSPSAAINCK